MARFLILAAVLIGFAGAYSALERAGAQAPSCAPGTTPYYGGAGRYSLAVNAPAGSIIDAAYLATANGCFGPLHNTSVATSDNCYLFTVGLTHIEAIIVNKTTREPTGVCPPIDRIDVRFVALTPVPNVPRGPQGAATLSPPTPGPAQRVADAILPTQTIPKCCAASTSTGAVNSGVNYSTTIPAAGASTIRPPSTGDGGD